MPLCFYFLFTFVGFTRDFFVAHLDLYLLRLPIHSIFCVQMTFATFTEHKLQVIPLPQSSQASQTLSIPTSVHQGKD